MPAQRHSDLESEILAQRKRAYEKAKVQRPECWSGNTRCWESEKSGVSQSRESSGKIHQEMIKVAA